MPNSPLIRRSVAALAITTCAALMSPAAIAGAAPADPAPVAPADLSLTAPEKVPGNDVLASAIRALQKSAKDPGSLSAARALLEGSGQLPTTEASAPAAAPDAPIPAAATPAADAGDIVSLLAQANKTLEALGIQSFINPSVAFNCTAPTDWNPFGLLPAVGGAVPGPFFVPGLELPPGVDANLVEDGETLFGFVPAGITKDGAGTGMQVAWFNVDTLKGGFVNMAPVGKTLVDIWLAKVPAGKIKDIAKSLLTPIANGLSVPGSRLAPVKTGNGTVLSAVFGTVENGNRSCFFLPMIGITQA